jgi:mannose-6-phosphate isomerase-like protein (cupin superfamily)
MLITKEHAHKKENSPSCTVWEYDFPSKELWFAIATINGRYPGIGKVINHKCDEMYYVLQGTWTIHQQSWTYEIKEGDCFLFEKQQRYRVEWNNLKIALPTAPARSLDQYEQIND